MKTTKKNQIIRVCLLSGLLLFTSQLFAIEYYSFNGRVISTGKVSVKNAIVTLSDPNTSETIASGKCKENGNFYIDNVPCGEFLLTVEKDGISRAKTKRILIDENGNYVERNIEIDKNDSNRQNNDLIGELKNE
jgi:hypothetical protein